MITGLTSEDLLLERPNLYVGGVQRIYRFKNGYGLSLINGPLAHAYPFAWEAAVLEDVSEDGNNFELTYDSPLTDDIIVFSSDEEANAFIRRAKRVLEAL